MEDGDGFADQTLFFGGDLIEQFEAVLAANYFGSKGFGDGADFAVGPAEGGAELGSGLPGVDAD